MAESLPARSLPKLTSSKATERTRKESSLTRQDESELISDPDTSQNKPKRKIRSPSKSKKASQNTGTAIAIGSGNLSPSPTPSPTRIRAGLKDSQGADNSNTNNSNRDTPRRKKKAAKSKSPGLSSNHSLQSGRSLPLSGDGSGTAELSATNLSGTQNAGKPRKKRRRKSATAPVSRKIESLGVDLADIEDDIIDTGTDADSENGGQAPYKSHMKSQHIGKLYIEQTRGFKSADKKVIEDLYSEDHRHRDYDETDEEAAYPTKLSPMTFALTSIRIFGTLSHFCMGILAGLAIWQTLYAFSFSNLTDTRPFLIMYRSMSIPVNCVFYIVIVFCTVATFDRYDVSKVTRPCLLKACTLQSGAVAAVLYVAALCVNVSMAPMDDRLGPRVTGINDTLRDFIPNSVEESRHLMMWRVLALVRAVLVGLAWFIISLRPTTDRLSKNLSKSEVTWGDTNEKSNHLT